MDIVLLTKVVYITGDSTLDQLGCDGTVGVRSASVLGVGELGEHRPKGGKRRKARARSVKESSVLQLVPGMFPTKINTAHNRHFT